MKYLSSFIVLRNIKELHYIGYLKETINIFYLMIGYYMGMIIQKNCLNILMKMKKNLQKNAILY